MGTITSVSSPGVVLHIGGILRRRDGTITETIVSVDDLRIVTLAGVRRDGQPYQMQEQASAVCARVYELRATSPNYRPAKWTYTPPQA